MNPDTLETISAGSSQGWQAQLELGFEYKHGKTVLAHRRHIGPLTVQRPFYPEGEVCHLYVLHPPGGVVAGDCLAITINAATNSAALVTTPAAGKFYRSDGKLARQTVALTVAAGASLEWLPQETIIYEGAQVAAEMRLELAAGAKFIGWEILALGRPAAQESFTSGEVGMNWQIFRAGDLFYRERLLIDAEAFAANWGLDGHSACGTLFAYPATTVQLAVVQTLIGDSVGRGVTLLDDLLICRALDTRADRLRDFFQEVWMCLRPDVVGRKACAPRIWAT
ncbi:MAG: urease accessory protein UreD [Methylovulum sp.]|uniref:urease accessory protein UreD n=1 Tax=Methylovulum sp. TaxID=1916980 RepID=UPI00260B9E94|nr:urease accessory protein UreD [Methylovulum sp.]MDD2724329.1 urease accessory protein UreD [Methylovulum sp.]MDD5124925.1 urease accessory protein UreD [Methylovulum sp.]